MPSCAIGLGSNLGDRERHLREAITALRSHLRDLRVSSLFETEPVEAEGGPFLNAACVGDTDLSPRALLRALQGLEAAAGRAPHPRSPPPKPPRTLDLDLLLYDDLVSAAPGLTVPHADLASRAFVLIPLAELVPDAIHPPQGRSIRDLAADVPGKDSVRLLKRQW